MAIVWILLHVQCRPFLHLRFVVIVHFQLDITISLEKRINRNEHAVLNTTRGREYKIGVLSQEQGQADGEAEADAASLPNCEGLVEVGLAKMLDDKSLNLRIRTLILAFRRRHVSTTKMAHR